MFWGERGKVMKLIYMLVLAICFVFGLHSQVRTEPKGVAEAFYIVGEVLKIGDVNDSSSIAASIWKSSVAQKIQQGDILQEGDYIWVQYGSLLMIRFFDGSTARIGPGSKFLIKQLYGQEDKNSVSAKIRLEIGKIWVQVKHLFDKKSNYEVEVDDVVAAAHGTDFAVEVLGENQDDKEYNLYVYDGKVKVTDSKIRPIIVGKDQFVATRLKQRLYVHKNIDQRTIGEWHQWNRALNNKLRLNPGLLRNRQQFREKLNQFRNEHPQLWKWQQFKRQKLNERSFINKDYLRLKGRQNKMQQKFNKFKVNPR